MGKISRALDRVLDFIDKGPLRYELVRARDEFFEGFDLSLISNEVAGFSLCLFQDWFLFERELESLQVIPIRAFYAEFSASFSPEEDDLYSSLTRTVYGIFRTKKIKASSVSVVSVTDKKIFDVYDHVPEGFRTDGLISARLVEFDGRFLFCPAVCFHPRSQTDNIVRLAKSIEGERELRSFFSSLSRINLKTKFYPEVDPDLFYRELFKAR